MSVWEKPQIILHIHKSVNYTVYDARWIPASAKCVVLGSQPRGTGTIQIYEIDKGELKLMKEVSSAILTEVCPKVFEDFEVRKKVEKWQSSDKFGRISCS